MSIKKRERDALALAECELAQRTLDVVVTLGRSKHACLRITARDGRMARKVIFASTPSCDRWLVHLKKDLRRVLAQFEPLRPDGSADVLA
jgi:hypothetical protein